MTVSVPGKKKMSGLENRGFVLDSYAVLALLNDEPGAARIEDLLRQARAGEVKLAMSLVNLGEVAYIVERRQGEAAVHSILAFLDAIPLEINSVGRDRVLAAAHIKAVYLIAYADAFAAALALELDSTLLTGDPEFQSLEGKISIEWMPQRNK
jgi:ribonuclease VapC